jgi:hypothetical protein
MKRILLFSLILLQTHLAPAQDGRKLEAVKIGYLTRRLDLSPEEAQRFWPIYNQYSDEMLRARQDARLNNTPEITLEENLLNIRKKYNAEFNKALPPDKVNNFYRAEKEFGNFVQKEMERRQLRQQQKRSMVKP